MSLFSSVPPEATLLLHLQISLTNPQVLDEGGTLSKTLLPSLSLIRDYTFLDEESTFIMTQFLNTLIRHIADHCLKVEVGFIMFALRFNPSIITDILAFHNNIQTMSQALTILGYPKSASDIMSHHPQKFLWPQLMKFWRDKTHDTINDCCIVLSKMDIVSDPGPLMNRLIDVFVSR